MEIGDLGQIENKLNKLIVCLLIQITGFSLILIGVGYILHNSGIIIILLGCYGSILLLNKLLQSFMNILYNLTQIEALKKGEGMISTLPKEILFCLKISHELYRAAVLLIFFFNNEYFLTNIIINLILFPKFLPIYKTLKDEYFAFIKYKIFTNRFKHDTL